ncbi:MAG: cation diffusion facilitator family transporter [Eubacterium sp.]|nr:cation diffusion facilitator family transporter [Eubacterium sp.]
MNREKQIVRTSIIGIIANVMLAAFKAVIGLVSNSIAIIMDAVNNLSDALSSIITIIGTKLAAKAPDKKHPLGHGRIEYLSAMVISVIILYAGVTSLIESVKKIISPEVPEYKSLSLVIIAVAVAVKIILGTYVKKVGKNVNSDALVASGTDALFDSIISTATLVAAIIYIVFGLSLESWLGAIISIIIIKSGLEMLSDTISDILGKRIDPELAKSIKASINSFENVRGTYDLVVHNYGPEFLIGSAHIEVPDTLDIKELDMLERRISEKVYADTGVTMAGLSIYSYNTKNKDAERLQKEIKEKVLKHEHVLQLHGFYLEEDTNTIRFDIVVGFETSDRRGVFNDVVKGLEEAYPDYKFSVALDQDISD